MAALRCCIGCCKPDEDRSSCGVVLAFREKDEWLLNWKGGREGEGFRSFVRSAELLSSRPSLSFDSSPTQEIPLSRNDFFGIYCPIIPLKYFTCGIDSNVLS